MYCSSCGTECPPEARFCPKCGMPFGEQSPNAAPATNAPQNRAHNQRESRKMIGLSILAIALAGISAVLALVIVRGPTSNVSQPVLIPKEGSASQGTQSNKANDAQGGDSQSGSSSGAAAESNSDAEAESAASTPTDSATSAAKPAPAPAATPEEEAVASLDGWWAQIGGRSTNANGAQRYRGVIHVENGQYQTYDANGNVVESGKVSPQSTERADILQTSGWYFNALGLYMADDQPDTLTRVNRDGSGYSGTSSYGRLEGEPEW